MGWTYRFLGITALFTKVSSEKVSSEKVTSEKVTSEKVTEVVGLSFSILPSYCFLFNVFDV